MKKQVVSLFTALLLMSMLPFGAQAADNGYGGKVPATVMSYNIHHGVGLDNQLSLERIAGVIRDAGADIVGLQEVDRFYGERSGFRIKPKNWLKCWAIIMLTGQTWIWLQPKDRLRTVSTEPRFLANIRS